MPPQPDLLKLLESLVYLAIEGLLLALLLVLFSFSFRALRTTWRRGLLFGIVAGLLSLPSAIVGIVYLDMSRLLPHQPGQPEIPPAILHVGAAMVALLLLLVMVPLRGVYYHVAAVEWAHIRGSADEGLAGPHRTRLLGIVVGIGVGIVMTLLTYAVFYLCHVQESEDVRQLQSLFPGMEKLPSWLMVIVAGAFVSSAAMVEEMIFRGGLLGFLLRATRNHALLAWVWIAAVAFLWALLHIPNTDMPVIKVAQIFIQGLALGGMTRRWGIASAISAHVTLNITAVLASMIIPNT